MNEYEIKTDQRGMTYYENVKAIDILSAISVYYRSFGYQRIVSIRMIE